MAKKKVYSVNKRYSFYHYYVGEGDEIKEPLKGTIKEVIDTGFMICYVVKVKKELHVVRHGVSLFNRSSEMCSIEETVKQFNRGIEYGKHTNETVNQFIKDQIVFIRSIKHIHCN